MSNNTVKKYEDIVNTVKAFNIGLEEGKDLEDILSYFRAWYYIPEIDLVGPSKFIGYQDMTASEYMSREDLDGRVTEPVMGEWFDALEEGEAESEYVSKVVQSLLHRFGKSPNRMARYCAPRSWRINGRPVSHPAIQAGSDEGQISPTAEVFWRAFLNLYPEDQEILSGRIVQFVRGKK